MVESRADAPAAPAHRPLIITSGGTYSGSWASDDPHVPVVLVKTAEPVIIENSELRGRGHLIATGVAHCDITIRNTRGFGLNPNVAGRIPGRFFTGESCNRVLIEHCEMTNTAGIWLLKYGGDFSPLQTFKFLYNRAINIDGRKSDGKGGFVDYNLRKPLAGGKQEKGYYEVQFVQFDKVRHLGGIEIAWNQVINDPGNSRVEDNINIFLSSGTAENPIRIHDNFIRGGYTIRPWQKSTKDDTYRYDWTYSGGGIMLADGSAERVEDAAGFVEAFNNQVVGTSNYGIAIAAGHDCCFHDNRMVSCGRLADGRAIASQNVGGYIWDPHHDAKKDPPTFFNNSAHDNVIGWISKNGRNDGWHPDAAKWQNNRSLGSPITLQTEQAEWDLWQQKLKQAHITVGPMTSK